MNRRSEPALLATTLALLVLTAPGAQAAGQVDVTWVQPETYADIGRSAIDRDRTLQSLGEHLHKLAQRLPDGQVLKIAVTDLDLAGEIRPWGWHDVRVLRGRADWPHMSLRYTLSADGRTLKSGDAKLSDMSYLQRPREGELGYEKRMLDDWFKAEFFQASP